MLTYAHSSVVAATLLAAHKVRLAPAGLRLLAGKLVPAGPDVQLGSWLSGRLPARVPRRPLALPPALQPPGARRA